jgi:hypothetical protein
MKFLLAILFLAVGALSAALPDNEGHCGHLGEPPCFAGDPNKPKPAEHCKYGNNRNRGACH